MSRLKVPLLFVLVAFILCFASLRYFIFYVNHHKQQIETWFTQFMRQTVTMSSVDAHWHGGKPAIHFHDITILSADKKTILTKINDLDVGVAIWGSLRNRQLTPSYMVAAGVHLDLNNNNIIIESIKIKGSLDLNADNGHVKFWLSGINAGLPRVFDNAQRWQQLSGKGDWQRTPKGGWLISGHDLNAQTGAVALSGDFSTEIMSGLSPVVAINLGFEVNDLRNLSDYLPRKIMDKRLHHWLTHAIQGGALHQGKLVINGPLQAFPFDHGEGQFWASADVQNMQLRFNRDWLPITHFGAKLIFHNRLMSLQAKQGDLGNCHIKQALAEIKNLAASYLTVDGELIGDIREAVAIVNQSPLQQTVGKEIHHLNLSGPITLDLHLGTSFAINRPPIEVKGDIHLQGSQCQVGATPVVAKNLEGKIHFTSDSVQADALSGSLFANPISMSIKSLKENNKVKSTKVVLQGEMDLDSAAADLGVKLLPQLDGRTEYQAIMQLHRVDDPTPDELMISSSLKGISLDFPEPLQKAESDTLEFTSHLLLGHQGSHHLTMNFGKDIKINCDIDTEPTWSVKGAAVQLGDEHQSVDFKPGQLVLDGYIAAFDWDDWQALWSQLSQNGKSARPKLTPVLDVEVGELAAFGQTLTDVVLDSHQEGADWSLKIRSKELNGLLQWPDNYPHSAIKIDLDRLTLRDIKSSTTDLHPEDIPPLDIRIDQFKLNDIEFGRVELSLTPGKDVLKINHLSTTSSNMQFLASGSWRNLKDFKQTLLTGTLQAQDIGHVLDQFGVTDNVVGGAGQATFTLAWFDTLLPEGFGSLNGQVHLDFKAGRIKKLSQETQVSVGLARLLNLLSLQSLPRRLTLDFSDLNQSGYHFDTFEGNLLFKKGSAYTENLTLEGTVAKVQVGGKIGLKDKNFDLHMFITPHVTSSIPVVAAIAAGPVAGVVAWVGEKIVRRAADKVTSLTYKVSGPWDKPIVTKQG